MHLTPSWTHRTHPGWITKALIAGDVHRVTQPPRQGADETAADVEEHIEEREENEENDQGHRARPLLLKIGSDGPDPLEQWTPRPGRELLLRLQHLLALEGVHLAPLESPPVGEP